MKKVILFFAFIAFVAMNGYSQQHKITINCNDGGTISPIGDTLVNSGDSLVIVITPIGYSTINKLEIDGKDSTSRIVNNTYTLRNINQNHSVTAIFNTYTYSRDLERLRDFLRKPSAEIGKLNINQLWKAGTVDTTSWLTATNWVDSIKGLTWERVESDKSLKVKKILWSNQKLADTLNMYDFRYLDTLQCSQNKLTALVTDGCSALKQLLCDNNRLERMDAFNLTSLKHLACEKNKMRFSTLVEKKSAYTTYTYTPQDSIFLIQGIADTVNLGREALIYNAATTFKWFSAAGGAEIPSTIYSIPEAGKFIFSDSYIGQTLICQMENGSFPGMTQICRLQLSRSYDSMEVAKLKIYLQQPSYISPQTNGEQLGLPQNSSWDYSSSLLGSLKTQILWDNSSPKRVTEVRWEDKQNLAGILDLSGFTKMTNLIITNNRISGLNIAGNTSLTIFQCGSNFLKFSTLPKDQINNYSYSPQKDINDTIFITNVVDLGSEYSITRSGSSHTTRFTWLYNNTYVSEGIEALGNGKFRLADQYVGKKLTCEMTNDAFTSLNLKYVVVVKAAYDTNELKQLKTFLQQPSAEEGKLNIEQVGTKPHDWTFFNSVVEQISTITWDNTVSPKKIKSIHWNGKNIAGDLVLSKFSLLSDLQCSNNNIASISLSDCPALATVECNDNSLTRLSIVSASGLNKLSCENNYLLFSTLPKQTISDYSYSPQREINRSIFVYDKLDLSAEHSIERNSVSQETQYGLYDVVSLEPLSSELYTILGNGFISFNDLLEDTSIICRMTNANFPGLEIDVRVHLMKPNYDDLELNQVKAFLENISTDEEKTNADQLGINLDFWNSPGKWPVSAGFTWSRGGGKANLQSINWNKQNLAGVINFSNFEQLRYFFCSENAIESIDLSNSPLLEEVECFKNNISSINLQGCSKLTYLTVSHNKIKNLDLSTNNQLIEVYCHQNELKQLNLTGCSNLLLLSCYNNEISSLDLLSVTALQKLFCSGNALKFSTLPTQSYSTYDYSYQDTVYILGASTSSSVDLSSEFSIARNGETYQTEYNWYTKGSDTPIKEGITNNNGFFSFNSIYENQSVYGTMTNAAFPGLTLNVQVNFFGTGENPLATNQKQIQAIVFPNPAKDIFNLQIQGWTGKLNMSVFNSAGKLVLEQYLHFVTDSESKQISVQNLPKGMYYVRLYEKDFNQILKLIIN